MSTISGANIYASRNYSVLRLIKYSLFDKLIALIFNIDYLNNRAPYQTGQNLSPG
jgi:hypothetical protein